MYLLATNLSEELFKGTWQQEALQFFLYKSAPLHVSLNFLKFKIFWIITSYLYTLRKRLMLEVRAYRIVGLSRESERLGLP